MRRDAVCLAVAALAVGIMSCRTTKDLELTAQAEPVEVVAEGEVTAAPAAPAAEAPAAPAPTVAEKKVYVEKPIYVPAAGAGGAGGATGGATAGKAGDAVAGAAADGVMKPADYNGASIVYDYDDALVYQVFTMPLRVTDLYLQPGEKLVEQPFCGDTTRWNIGGGVARTAGVETQHLYVKPNAEGLETTLIVNTDRRIYHLIIKSFKDIFMFSVTWRYPGSELPLDFLSAGGEGRGGDGKGGGAGKSGDGGASSSAAAVAGDPGFTLDPTRISSDYTMSYPKNNPPTWLPTMVVDDGSKTYIVLPAAVLHHELPAVFGESGNLVNFRVRDNLIVIDRLLTRILLKLGNVTVEIRKKGT